MVFAAAAISIKHVSPTSEVIGCSSTVSYQCFVYICEIRTSGLVLEQGSVCGANLLLLIRFFFVSYIKADLFTRYNVSINVTQ